jgi:hemolysin III
MNNSSGITLLSVLQGLTAVGIIFKIFLQENGKFLSTLMYIALGCIVLVGGRTFFESIPGNTSTVI